MGERRAHLAEEAATYPKYRWVLLCLAWALYSLIAFNNTMTAVLYDLRDPVALGGILYVLAPETGRKARERWERETAEAQQAEP